MEGLLSLTTTARRTGEVTPQYSSIPAETEQVVSAVIEAAFRVHRTLGPGLLESVYEICLCHGLSRMELSFERQVALPVSYDGLRLDAGLRLDVSADGCVIVELKAVEQISDLHKAQLLTYFEADRQTRGTID